MEANHDYVEKLDKLISDYHDSPDQELLYSILELVFNGIAENYAVSCPVKMNTDNLTCEPLVASGKDGKDYLVIFTQENNIGDPTVAALKLQGLMYFVASNDDCKGIIFNPYGDHRLLIPKELFINAFTAAWSIAFNEKEQNKEPKPADDNAIPLTGSRRIACERPMDCSLFEVLEDRIRNLTDDPDDFITVVLEKNKDDLLYVQTKRHDEFWYVELVFDMSDFDWEYPLILGTELELEEAVELFKLLLVHRVSPDDLRVVQDRFRDIGFTGPED
jgi:hypothetical protein